jgi:hypothetical protein
MADIAAHWRYRSSKSPFTLPYIWGSFFGPACLLHGWRRRHSILWYKAKADPFLAAAETTLHRDMSFLGFLIVEISVYLSVIIVLAGLYQRPVHLVCIERHCAQKPNNYYERDFPILDSPPELQSQSAEENGALNRFNSNQGCQFEINLWFRTYSTQCPHHPLWQG